MCTILSQNTTDVNSHRAFTKLKDRFPEWEDVCTADSGTHLDFLMLCSSAGHAAPMLTMFTVVSADVEESIKSGGLAAIKTARIKVCANHLACSTHVTCFTGKVYASARKLVALRVMFASRCPPPKSCFCFSAVPLVAMCKLPVADVHD